LLPPDHFIEKDVLFERAKDNEESPASQTWINEASVRSELRVLSDQLAGRFDGIKVAVCDIPPRLGNVPFKLALDVRDKIVGLANVHDVADFVRARTRSRMQSKSSRVRGVVGLSAASDSHTSNSGVT